MWPTRGLLWAEPSGTTLPNRDVPTLPQKPFSTPVPNPPLHPFRSVSLFALKKKSGLG